MKGSPSVWMLLLLLLGNGCKQQSASSITVVRGNAESGDAVAQYKLGVCYSKGEGVAKDELEAVKWWRKAADQNYAKAQDNLGTCYYKGEGVAKDYVEAVKWFRKAAEGGAVKSFSALAWILATSNDSAIRDGSNAMVFAEKAVAVTNRKTPAELDTLAAAYAEAGQFEKAVSTEHEAIALLQTEAEQNDYRTRLELFEARLPYRAKD
jgi:TPR repeat protein